MDELVDRGVTHVMRWHHRPVTQHESVAEHQWHVAWTAYLIAVAVKDQVVFIDPGTAMLIGLLHDQHEIETGDLPNPSKYAPGVEVAWRAFEDRARDRLFGGVPPGLRPPARRRRSLSAVDPDAAWPRHHVTTSARRARISWWDIAL